MGGLRALTHRSVDNALGLPAGSVNYYAPTRSRLHMLAFTEAHKRMYEVALAAFGPVLALGESGRLSTDDILEATTDFVVTMSTEARGVVNARHALLIESQFDEELRAQEIEQRAAFVSFTEPFARANEPVHPNRSAEIVVAMIEGLIQQQTLVTSEIFPRYMIRAALARIFGFPGGEIVV